MKITEIFHSIQGEIDVGKPSIFIRTSTCNMEPKCKFCDTKYSWEETEDTKMSIIKDEIRKFNCNHIVFT